MKRLRILLVIHLIFFAAWGAKLLASHQAAAVVWLETDPVDPRDLLKGHYVELRFRDLEKPEGPGCESGGGAAVLYVRLIPKIGRIETEEGPIKVWEAGECVTELPPQSDDRVWLKGERAPGREALTYGIERFYVPEKSPLRSAQSGQVAAKVSVNSRRQARMLDLVQLL